MRVAIFSRDGNVCWQLAAIRVDHARSYTDSGHSKECDDQVVILAVLQGQPMLISCSR